MDYNVHVSQRGEDKRRQRQGRLPIRSVLWCDSKKLGIRSNRFTTSEATRRSSKVETVWILYSKSDNFLTGAEDIWSLILLIAVIKLQLVVL
jgi:hypothetical protein